MNIFKYRVLNHILFWIFIYVFYTMPFVLTSGDLSEASINLIYIPFDIITVYVVIEFLIPQFLLKNRKLLLFLLGLALIISFNITISQYIRYQIQPLLGFWTMSRPLIYDLFYSLLSNFMIVGLASAMKLLRYSYHIQLSQSELERRTAQSELNILRSQINPHFLFNTLNNIDSLIFEDRDKASNAIFLLSKIMRYMLQESNADKVTVENELAYIRDYLKLVELSFKNPDFIRYRESGGNTGKEIPPLLFIPIIENTIKHCNKQVNSPGVDIEFRIDEDFITLKTQNYIKPNNLKLPEPTTGTGLKNVEKRLKLLYNGNYKFDINKNDNKFEVFIQVPLQRNNR